MILENFNVKEVFKQGNSLNLFQYYQLRKLIEKLMKFDKNNDCFGDCDLLEKIDHIIDNYNIFSAKRNCITIAGLLIGSPYDDETTMTIAYVVAEKYRQQGIGTELLGRAITTCFEEYDCSQIVLSASADNIPSRKMIENSHFTFIDEDSMEPRSGTLVKKARYLLDYNQYIKKYDEFKKYKSFYEGNINR